MPKPREIERNCHFCGKPVEWIPHKGYNKFCSSGCRLEWEIQREELIQAHAKRIQSDPEFLSPGRCLSISEVDRQLTEAADNWRFM